MKKKIFLFSLLGLLLFTLTSCNNHSKNIIIVNANVLTVDKDYSTANALVIENNKIVYVGDDEGALAYKNSSSNIINAKGNTITPANADGHMHFGTTALTNLYEVRIDMLSNIDEFKNAIREYIKLNPDKNYCLGYGWNTFFYGENDLNKYQLDEVSKEIPIVMMSKDLHAAWANTKALEMLGVKEGDKEYIGYIKDALAQKAPYIIHKYTKDEIKKAMLNEQKTLNGMGIASIVDIPLAIQEEIAEAYHELAKENKLTLRVRMQWVLQPNEKTEEELMKEIDHVKELSDKYNDTDYFKIIGFKFFADQVLEQGTAYMCEPTLDAKNNKPFWDKEELKRLMLYVDSLDMQIHVHQIGDGAAKYVLDILEDVRKINGDKDRRTTFVHCQFMLDEDKKRCADLGVNIMIEPVWTYYEDASKKMYIPMLGDRINRMYPMQSLFDAGINVGFHSDYIITPPSPILNSFMSLKRGGEYGSLPNTDNEAMTLDEYFKASTINTAYSMYLDDITGSIEVGKKADIIMLNKKLPPYTKENIQLPDMFNLDYSMMIFDGNILYQD